MNKEKNNVATSGIKYFTVIGLSVLGMILVVISIGVLITQMTGQANVNGFVFERLAAIIPKWAIITVFIIALGTQAPLTVIRQRLRDEYEYDENGVSRKKGKFSQLSKKERDEIEQAKMLDAERLLDSPTVKSITHKGSLNPNEDMKTLIGMNNVKRDMHEMVARVQYEFERQKDDKKKKKFTPISSMHMVFMGNPGTGKTVTARIMTGFLYQLHYIKKNKCVEVDGNFFAGLTPSDSTKKTKMLIQNAIGGVLFIDEAYALLSKSGSQEVVATLIKEMEDRRQDLVIILAGYDEEMKRLIASNPGIESRVKKYIHFDDYSIDELQQIFLKFAGEEGFTVSAELMNEFIDRISYEKKQPNFGNARAVRNLLDKIIDRHAVNLYDGINAPEDRYRLTAADMPQIDTRKHI